MRTGNDEYQERYIKETRDLFCRRVSFILLVGIILIPIFGILDYVVAREYFKLFLIYRIGCCAILTGLYLFYLTKTGKNHAYPIALVSYIVTGLTMSILCVHLGGYEFYYYAGVVMVLVTFNVILPLNALQAGASGIMLFFIYAVPIILFSDPTAWNLKILFSNSFFFVFFTLITMLQCYEETQVRFRECKLKVEMDSLAGRLSYYAHNLEAEVDKRMKALEESELRYRELYENIIDIVILVDTNSKILMANPRFYETIGIPVGQRIEFSFMNLVINDDTSLVSTMFRTLRTEHSVNDVQFRIRNRRGKVFEVECNAKGIYKERTLIGYQMVVRDITVRKKLERDLIDSYKKVKSARNATILGLAKLAEYRDSDTGAHLERIREYSKVLAEELAGKPAYAGYITREYVEDIYNSSILHDIGKVGIPDSILLKPAKLSQDEFKVVKRHSNLGGDALKAVEAKIEGQSFLSLGKEIAYYHHEKWDGSGYPEGLKGQEIPLSARIVALADVYDALTSKRVYKDAFSHAKATEIIVNGSGTHFDPDIVEAFLAHENDFMRIREEMFSNPEVNLGHEGYGM
ncbi:MAG TPA: PAS domain S-box protein, partial [Deltaproteobacteria bacterium]|nr:PAS domain S-box protein [Deltaproteobacteria bacterium]